MKKLLAGLLSFFIAIAIVELLARAASVFVHDAEVKEKTEDPWYVYSADIGWERKPGFDNTFGGVRRKFDEEGLFAGDQSKFSDSTKKKILFVGDSNTFGNDSPVDAIFPSLVDSLLPDAVSFNLGSPGYSSYQGKILLERMLPKLRPDVVVISFNFNDRRYVLHPADADSKETFQRNYDLARRQELIATLEKSYTFRAVRAAVRMFGVISEERILPVRVDSLVARVSPEQYRSNLTAMVIAAQRKEIPVLFLLLGDNPVQTEYLQKGVR
ncbi:MAG: SGNH/GDSL hydrolase family protein, partial [bacterium]